MSLVFAPPQHQKDGVPTVQRLLDENSRLIEDIKEQQNLGRAEEVLKRQQLLHRNLVYLAKLADQSLLAQLQPDGGGLQNANGEQQHSGQQRPSSNGENQAPMTPQMMSQNTVPPNGMPPPVPVPVPTPSHLLQPPTVQVTQHTLNGQPPPRGSPGSAMLSPGQQAAYYGASQQPSPGQRYAQAMNAPHGFPAPVQPQRIQSPMMSQAQGVPTTHPGMTHPSQQQHPGMPPHSMPSGMHPGLTMGQPPPMQGQPSPSQPGQMPHYYGQPPSSQAGYPGMPPQHMMQHPQMGQPGMAPGYPMPYPGQQMHPAYAQQQTPPTSQPQQGQQYMR